jgi:type II restriction/modification system DNA methylase subunit YeeA
MMLNNPDSRLVEQMDYYIKPEEPETDFLKISSPEEIKICDPACGSGHMLTYAFDLLYAIYEEQGYQATDIPRLIVTRNLYGIEIDQRAGSLAAFALTMKAREKYRRFLTKDKATQPNICVLANIKFEGDELSSYMDQVGRDLFTQPLEDTLKKFEEADNFGSLIRPQVDRLSEVLEILRERQMGADLFLVDVHQKVLTALRQADYLSPKYHVVVANPPYMGSRNMGLELKEFCQKKYPDCKSDLFSAFIERNLNLVTKRGTVGMITMQAWMFLSSYEALRSQILDDATILTMAHLGERAFDSIGGAVVSTTAFVLANAQISDYRGTFLRLTDGQSEAEKSASLLVDQSVRYKCTSADLRKIEGYPIAYWISDRVRDVFREATPLGHVAEIRQGLATGENDLFVRQWFETSLSKIGFDCPTGDAAKESDKKWFPYNKGGGHRKWYGNNEFVVNWWNDGQDIRSDKLEKLAKGKCLLSNSKPKNTEHYFREGITYGLISTTGFTARRVYGGAVFDVGGSMVFPNFEIDRLQGFLCSTLSTPFLTIINPTLNYQVGDIEKLPIFIDEIQRLDIDWGAIIQVFQDDWNAQETAWDFESQRLLANADTASLARSYEALRSEHAKTLKTAFASEQQNNKAFVAAYGLTDEVGIEPLLTGITLDCNPHYRYGSDKSELELESLLLADTMREFISYAVGCMLGRYSLDKPGLILANQGETADDYREQVSAPTFAPDEDNVIPLLDGDWFTDDISERFKEFLKVTFGTEHFDENLTFLENALYPDNGVSKKRKTIRDYFLKEFYNHHIKLYKKRPIYWLFSSPKGTFNALIYMHRYRSDTVSVVLNGYLREFQTKLRGKLEQLQHVADIGDASKAEKTKALKTIDTLNKQLKELEDYERDILFPLAQEQIEIDLDDGVKLNYNKFGTALKKVVGLTGK